MFDLSQHALLSWTTLANHICHVFYNHFRWSEVAALEFASQLGSELPLFMAQRNAAASISRKVEMLTLSLP